MIYLLLHIYKDVDQRYYFLECICSLTSKERERKKKKSGGDERGKENFTDNRSLFLEKIRMG